MFYLSRFVKAGKFQNHITQEKLRKQWEEKRIIHLQRLRKATNSVWITLCLRKDHSSSKNSFH